MMQFLFFGVVIAIMLYLCGSAPADTPPEPRGVSGASSSPSSDVIDRMIAHIVRNTPGNPMYRARRRAILSDWIAVASAPYGVPDSLVVSVIFKESSFRRGQIGRGIGREIGYMQVHPETGRQWRCDLRTPKGQIRCGCRILRAKYDLCHSWRGALRAYGSRSGKCNAGEPGSKLVRSVDARLRLAEELEELFIPAVDSE
jgi:hypothetical protein